MHKHHYQPMLQKAGLPYVHPHDLRNIAATLLLLDKVRCLRSLCLAFSAMPMSPLPCKPMGLREIAHDALERRIGNLEDDYSLAKNPEK